MPRVSDDELEPERGDLDDYDPESVEADMDFVREMFAASFAQKAPMDGAWFFCENIRYGMGELGATMHLSGDFDLSEDEVRELVQRYSSASIQWVFDSAGPRFAKGEELEEKITHLRFLGVYFRKARACGKWEMISQYQLAEDMRERMPELLALSKEVSRLAREIRTNAGISKDRIEKFVERLRGTAQERGDLA